MPNFTWDPHNNSTNRDRHGLDFEDAPQVFDDPNRIEWYSDRRGERRFLTVGKVFGLLLTLIYYFRRTAIRIISFRQANTAEREAYRKFNKNNSDHE